MPYIGNQPGTGVRSRFIYTATASQTTFTGADNNSKTLKYSDADYIDVYLNGVCLVPVTDYAASTKTSVVLVQAASLNDTLEVVAYDIATISDTVSKADGGTFEANVTFANGADIITATAGTDNVRLGENAGDSIASGGNYNVAIGKDAGTALTTGDGVVALGYEALKTEDANGTTTAIGYQALKVQNAGAESNNTAVGYQAGVATTTGGYSTFIGSLAGTANTTGQNTFLGAQAGQLNTDGTNNLAVGVNALQKNTTGDFSTAIGHFALQEQVITDGSAANNTAVGYLAGQKITTGTHNTFIGGLAGDATDDGIQNVAVGYAALSANAGNNNTAVGESALTSTTGIGNAAFGNGAGNAITSGNKNTVIGSHNGNQNNLDIRTSDNNIVISDGDANPRMFFQNGGSPAWVIGNNQSNVVWPGATSASGSNGIWLEGSVGTLGVTSNASPFYLNKNNADGTLALFYSEGNFEGSIAVSGSTVSYNGGHLSRWSQLADGSKDNTLVKGTVMTNLDKMAVWEHAAVAEGDTIKLASGGESTATADDVADAYTENNEQLNCMAVSSVEGDPNVSGVFVDWDDQDDGYNDLRIAMTGDMVIRIAKGVTIARGDLLMSAGDGTAKPQDDDIVRSKTIAKVTSTNVSHTYDDESYLVPCVLMAC